MDCRAFANRLSRLRGKTLATFHSHGDVDAVASAIAISKLVKADVRAIDSVSSNARKILTELNITIPKPVSPQAVPRYDNIILCDVSNPDLLGGCAEAIEAFHGTKLVIDHHVHNHNIRADAAIIEHHRSSASEIVFEIMEAAAKTPKTKITEPVALLLLAGILTDSAFFKSAGKPTFKAFSKLLDLTKKDYNYVIALAEEETTEAEKIARLKAIQRATTARTPTGNIICSSQAGAFELSCASALVQAGCDVAFVANPKIGRISGAKRTSLTSLRVGKIMELAGAAMRGSGGGHDSVGGAKGDPQLAGKALEKCVELATAALAKAGRRARPANC